MKIKNILLYLLYNGLTVFGLAFLVIKILDWYNPFMNFSGHSEIIQYMLIIFGMGKGSGAALMMFILGISGSLICIIIGRKLKKYQYSEM